MSAALCFQQKELEKKYHQDVSSHLQFVQSAFLYTLLFKQVIQKVLLFILDRQRLKISWISEGVGFLGVALLLLLVRLLSGRIKRVKKLGCKKLGSKCITNLIDVIGMLSIFTGIYFLYKSRMQIVADMGSRVNFNEGFHWAIMIGFVWMLGFNWYSKAIFLTAMLLITSLDGNPLDTQYDKMAVAEAVLSALLGFALFYSQEKMKKQHFEEEKNFPSSSESWEKIINTLPEGIVVLNQNKEACFYNDSLLNMLNETSPNNRRNSAKSKGTIKIGFDIESLSIFQDVTLAQSDRSIYKSLFIMNPHTKNKEDEVKKPLITI